MIELTTFSNHESHALRTLINDGIHDFEIQVARDPRMMGYIADSPMSLDDYRNMHAQIKEKLRENETFDCRLFDRDETMFITHLAQEGDNIGSLSPDSDAGRDARKWHEHLIAKANAMDNERRASDSYPAPEPHQDPAAPKPERTYSRATLVEAGKRLDAGDWDAHRKLAQIVVESGYAAEVVQDYNNDAAAVQPLTHSIRILEASKIQPLEKDSAGLSTQFDAMGGTTEVEQFTPDRPHGDYGPKTPFDDAPINPDEPSFPKPSDAHLNALSAQPPSPQSNAPGPSFS